MPFVALYQPYVLLFCYTVSPKCVHSPSFFNFIWHLGICSKTRSWSRRDRITQRGLSHNCCRPGSSPILGYASRFNSPTGSHEFCCDTYCLLDPLYQDGFCRLFNALRDLETVERSQVWLKAILVNEPKGLSSEGRLVSAHQRERVGTMH